jgi:hypothetical protein
LGEPTQVAGLPFLPLIYVERYSRYIFQWQNMLILVVKTNINYRSHKKVALLI